MLNYKTFGSERIEEIYTIYQQNGWQSYLGNKAKLAKAFDNSLYILGAFDNDKLVGFVRCIGDDQYILYVQDLIVSPSYHRQGIGSALMQKVLQRYNTIRQFVLITDSDDKIANAFYKSIDLVQDCNGYEVNHYFRPTK